MFTMTKRRRSQVDRVTARPRRSPPSARASEQISSGAISRTDEMLLAFSRRVASVAAPAALVLVMLGCGSATAEVSFVPAAVPPPTAKVIVTPPPVAAGDAVLEGDRIKIAKPIFYDTDKDEIKPESYPVLQAVASILASHPEITGLIVAGHTDNQGTFDHNRQLSERRSSAVVRYLASIGVKQPMQAPGYGATAPLCRSDDEACRQTNRRVEFRVKKVQ